MTSAATELVTVPLNELPAWSPWPARIMGLNPWTIPNRNTDKVNAEYHEDKYKRQRDWIEQHGEDAHFVSAEQVWLELWKLSPDQQVCISESSDLFLVTMREAIGKQFELLRLSASRAVEGCRSLIELGCGAGYNLYHLRQYLPGLEIGGGEYSANGVAVARWLGQNVVEFNYYDPSTYAFLESFPEPIAIFTSHSLEQLPSAAAFLENLSAHRKRIRSVLHLEPVRELNGLDLLGMLRSRYTEVNDYNRDLFSVLKKSGVKIDRTDYDLLGFNPLNPTSLIQWHF